MEVSIIFFSLCAAALITLMVRRRAVIEVAAVVAVGVALVESVTVALRVAATGNYVPSEFFSVDALGALLMLLISCVGLAAVTYSVQYLRKETAKKIIGFTRSKQYYILLDLFLAAMFLAVSSSSPIIAWISIEATTLSTAFLISFYNKPSAVEAAWKYLIINSIGLLLAFFGTLLFFSSLQTSTGFATWTSLLNNASHLDPVIAKIAFIFVLIGYGTKVGLAPMHTWLPDAHSKAPVPVSALLSGVLLNVAFITILRFKVITAASVGPDFPQRLLIIFGLLSILVASFIIFTQYNYKRLLAYSSIENMGITALGFGLGGVGVFAALLHMIYHSLLKSALFLLSGNIFLKYSSTKIAKVKGALSALPITSVLFLIGIFAITGAPPFGIFLTKILIFSSGITLHPFLTVVAMLLTAMVFIGFLKHASDMFFGEKPHDLEPEKEKMTLIIPPFALITLVLYLSFYQPAFLQVLIKGAALNY
ncbi:MAG: proton-conducting transporter membrane subunit [Patescibacteria group bacterium]|jgi:hydrogenase-4 component F